MLNLAHSLYSYKSVDCFPILTATLLLNGFQYGVLLTPPDIQGTDRILDINLSAALRLEMLTL